MEFLGPDGGKIRKTWNLGLRAEQQLWDWNGNQSQEEGGLYPLLGVEDVREDRTKTIC